MTSEAQSSLTEPQRELIAFFVNAAQAFGVPKSIGEIYGLYFASEVPLALDDVIEKLVISKGSASQGIRFLRSINALNTTYVPGDRRDHYTAELSLRRIADGFIKERIGPQLKNGNDRLQEVARQFNSEQIAPLEYKLDNIRAWSKKAELLLPFVSKFLGSASSKSKII